MTSEPKRVEADTLAVSWEHALEAAARAVDAVRTERVTADTIERERRLLTEERKDVAGLLHSLAAWRGEPLDGWLPPHLVTPHVLGLPPATKLVVFDLDGVLTDSDRVHAAAWAEALNPVLLDASHKAGWAFVPFDPEEEYHLYLDGHARLEGVELFLAGRGLRLSTDSVRAIARRKAGVLEHRLRNRAFAALPGSHHYLLATAHAGLGRAVVSASESTREMLELARLEHLVDVVIDAAAMRAHMLRSRPAADTLLEACAQLAVAPRDAVSLTHSAAGVAAAHAAGLRVCGIAAGAQAERLRGFGADDVVPSLAALLDPSLRA